MAATRGETRPLAHRSRVDTIVWAATAALLLWVPHVARGDDEPAADTGDAADDATDGADAAPAAAAPPAPVVEPPRLEEALCLPYPDDAPRGEGSVEVWMRIAIDDTGAHVASEIVRSGGEPFDTMAQDAARHLSFAPARIDGVATAVTVELPVRFVLPSPAPPPPPSGALVGRVKEAGSRRALAGVSVALSDAEEEDATPRFVVQTDREGGFTFPAVPRGRWTVTVRGEGHEVARFTEEIEPNLLRQVVYRVVPAEDATRTVVRVRVTAPGSAERVVEGEWIRGAAGSSGGFLRVLETDAAVAPTPVLPTGLFPGAPLIRGLEGGDSVVLVDGIETPLLYHFAALTTVVNADLIDYARLTPAGATAERGDHLGGVVDVALRPPRRDRFGGVVDVSPIDAVALLETPIGEPVSVYAAVRRSYVDAYLGKLLPEDLPAEVTAMPVYADLAAMVDVRPGKGHRIALSLLTSSDRMAMTQNVSGVDTPLAELEAGFTLVHGQWRSAPEQRFHGRVSLAYESSRSRYGAYPDLFLDAREKRFDGLGHVGARLSDRAELRGGLHVRVRELSYTENFFALPREDEPDLINPYATSPESSARTLEMTEVGIHLTAPLRPRDGLEVTPGVRVDRWDLAPAWTADPRVSARWRISEQVSARAHGGIYHQVPALEDIVETGYSIALTPEAAVQAGVGAQLRPIPALSFDVDLYFTGLWNLVVADASLYHDAMLGSAAALADVDERSLSNAGVGRVVGAEIAVRWRPVDRVDATLVYAVGRSERRDHADEAWRPYQYDRPHQLTVAAQARAPKGWSFGLRFRLASGAPDTPIHDTLFLADLGGYVPQWGLPYSERLRPYHQLDWRVEKSFRLPAFLLRVYLDVENTYFARRDDVVIYNRNFTDRLTVAMIPLFRLGLRVEF